MELPNWKMSDWRDVERDYGKRINVSMVAEYYQDYIKKMELDQYFINDTVVTSVRKVKDCSKVCDVSCASPETTINRDSNVKEDGRKSQHQRQPSSEGILLYNSSNEGSAAFQQESIFMQELDVVERHRNKSSTTDTTYMSDSSESTLGDVQSSSVSSSSDKNSRK